MFGDWGARRWRNGRLWCLALMTAFFTPIGLVFYTLAPGTPIFYLCWFLTSAGTSSWFGPLFAAIQLVTIGVTLGSVWLAGRAAVRAVRPLVRRAVAVENLRTA